MHVHACMEFQEKTKAQQLLDDVEHPDRLTATHSITLSVTIAGCHGVAAKKKGWCALIRSHVYSP